VGVEADVWAAIIRIVHAVGKNMVSGVSFQLDVLIASWIAAPD
jgi:hypothetical protein